MTVQMLWGLKPMPYEEKLMVQCLFSLKKTVLNVFQFFSL